jgi:hypothetical protein
LARSHFYLGTISIEASKITMALQTLQKGMDILNGIFKSEDQTEVCANADIAAMEGSLGYAKLLIGEVNAAKGIAYDQILYIIRM